MDTGTIVKLAIAALLIAFIYTRFKPVQGVKTLDAQQFRAELSRTGEKPLLLDVREPNEYASGFIPGAINLPLSQLRGRLAEVPQERDILLYCRSGIRSKSAAGILRKLGYTKLAHLRGGVNAWREPLDGRRSS